MNVDCPYCHASSVCESVGNADQQAVDQLSNLAVLNRAVHELCQSLGVHPLIKAMIGMTLIVAVQYLKSNHGSLPLTQKPYRCEDCNKIFTVFYPFV
jgi:hypothetical protein